MDILKVEDSKTKEVPEKPTLRTVSSLRIHYEAQVEVIKKQIGDLEVLRGQLGLSQRKMAQLLLVDPSAWTRWVKEGAPPSVWRALQWYMIVQQKIPGLTPEYFLGRQQIRTPEVAELREFKQILAARNDDIHLLQKKLERLKVYFILVTLGFSMPWIFSWLKWLLQQWF